MTVALGLICTDGVLVASDSMGTGEGFAAQAVKVHTFGRCPAVWTGSGSVFVMEEVMEVFNREANAGTREAPSAAWTQPIPKAIRTNLGKQVNKAMGEAYGRALSSSPMTPNLIHPNFVTNFLVLGFANNTPWFLEFAATGEMNWHTEEGFYAVGSGGPFATVAHALMRHYATSPGLTLELGKRLAYRTIQTTIDVSPAGVGPPVQIAICDAQGARVIDSEEISEIGTAVDGWKTLETETLRETPQERAEDAEGDLPALENG